MFLAPYYNAIRRAARLIKLGRMDMKSGLGDSAHLLYGLVRSMKPRVVVEIGSARGKSASFIAMGLIENGTGFLYAIDPHSKTNWNDTDSIDTYEIMVRNLEAIGVRRQVEILRHHSVEVASEWQLAIDMLFIDGDHSYNGVRNDWDLFSPFVRPHGIVVFHDTLWDLEPSSHSYRSDMGVPRLVDELRREGYPVITCMKDYGVSILQPVKGGLALSKDVT